MAAEDRMEQVEKEYPARASEAPWKMPRGKEGSGQECYLQCDQTELR